LADPARVLEEALTLEPDERARLAHQLIESLEKADADADSLWRHEIRRRIDEIEQGTVELEEWDDVRAQLRAAARA
jgi:putative addiction module component (TIGR02574 family)